MLGWILPSPPTWLAHQPGPGSDGSWQEGRTTSLRRGPETASVPDATDKETPSPLPSPLPHARKSPPAKPDGPVVIGEEKVGILEGRRRGRADALTGARKPTPKTSPGIGPLPIPLVYRWHEEHPTNGQY